MVRAMVGPILLLSAYVLIAPCVCFLCRPDHEDDHFEKLGDEAEEPTGQTELAPMQIDLATDANP